MAVDIQKCEKCGSYYNASNAGTCICCTYDMPHVSDRAKREKQLEIVENIEEILENDDEKTEAIIKKKTGRDPVVGWLVCKAGDEQGEDYKLYSDNNYIVQLQNKNIDISSDITAYKEYYAVISYDYKTQKFYLTPGKGTSLLYLNDIELLETKLIRAYDEIKIGNDIFVFAPFCGDAFRWEV